MSLRRHLRRAWPFETASITAHSQEPKSALVHLVFQASADLKPRLQPVQRMRQARRKPMLLPRHLPRARQSPVRDRIQARRRQSKTLPGIAAARGRCSKSCPQQYRTPAPIAHYSAVRKDHEIVPLSGVARAIIQACDTKHREQIQARGQHQHRLRGGPTAYAQSPISGQS